MQHYFGQASQPKCQVSPVPIQYDLTVAVDRPNVCDASNIPPANKLMSTLYLNATKVETRVQRDSLAGTIRTEAALRLGKHTSDQYGDFEGMLSDLQLYSGVLSDRKVASLHPVGKLGRDE